MLHDLIFALYGCPGSIFGETKDGIKPLKTFSGLHPSELTILEEICVVGTQYKAFMHFIRQHDGLHSSRKGISCGMYLKALASGIDEVLEAYRKDLVLLEKEILNDPAMSLFKLQFSLKKYALLFPALLNTINEVETKKLHGCPILNIVNQQSGVPVINSAYNKIQQTCHKPLFRQLTAWMVYGQLIDPHQEFFIRKRSSAATNSAPTIPTVNTNIVTRENIEKFQSDINLSSFHCFEVASELLPSYFSLELAKKIQFVGSSVCFFSTQNQTLKLTPCMFGEKEIEFSKSFSQLQNEEEFSLSQFKSAVDSIRICAAERLWKMVVCEGNLLTHLKNMKDFFLLGRGELFLSFIDLSAHCLDAPLTESTEYDLNNAFRIAASGVFSTEENDSDLFTLKLRSLDEIPDYKKEAGLKVWTLIELNYDIQWPLHTILTPDILEKYNRVFRFLLMLKHVEQELHTSWLLHMRNKSTRGMLWNLWFHMTYLIDNLQSFLQNDVLESQFTQLLDQVDKTKDFEAVSHAHQVFLNSIMSLMFLTWRPVYHCLSEITNLCRQACQLMRSQLEASERKKATEVLAKNFRRLTMLLYKNLSVAHSQQSHVNLGMLLLKLDFNNYFSQNGNLGIL